MSARRVVLSALSLGIALLLAAPAHAGSGGPDGFGYTWRDINDPAGCAIEDDGTPANSANYTSYVVGPIDIGFPFPFYDGVATQVWFQQAGLVCFVPPPATSLYANQHIPWAGDGVRSFIAPYWSFLVNTSPNVSWESRPDDGVFRVLFRYARPQSGTIPLEFEVYLYRTGDIRIEYLRPADGTLVTIGMEGQDETVADSFEIRYNGTQNGGMTYGTPTPFAICIDRPRHLACTEPETIGCDSTTAGASPASVPDNAQAWGCGAGTWAGKEVVYSLDVPELSDVHVTLSDTGLRTMAAYLLGSCDETDCFGGGSASFDVFAVPAGTYYLAVDALTELDEGTFTLEVSCAPLVEPLRCEDVLSDTTAGGVGRFDAYPCLAGDFSGAERFYTVAFVPPGRIDVTLDSITGQAAFILDASEPLSPDACLAGGVGGAALWDPPEGTYIVVVDGPPGGDGAYTIALDCGPAISCAGAGTIGCQETVTGSTVGRTPRTDFYRCSTQQYSGPEAVYEFTLDATDAVSFVLESAPDLDVIVLSACDEGACVGRGDQGVSKLLEAGTYYVVVDGKNGASGDFTLSIVCGYGLEPEVLTITSAAGECFTEEKRAWLTPELVSADILLALDLTGSMGGVRNQMIDNMNDLIDRLSVFIADPAFALASHRDYPATLTTPAPCAYSQGYGGTGDYAYKLDQPMTTDRATIEAAVAFLDPAAGGGDTSESYNRLLYEAVHDPDVAWRPGSRRLVVAFGDELPHDCNVLECLGGVGSPRGVDPGRDGTIGTTDDIVTMDVIQDFIDTDTALLHLTNSQASEGAYTYNEIWDCWSQNTGGESTQLNNDGTVPSGIDLAELIADLVQTRGAHCSSLELSAEPGWEDWVSYVSPVYYDIGLPASVEFTITFCVPPGTAPGAYDFTVRLMCGSEIVTTQQVHVDVTGDCDVTNSAPPPDVTVAAGGTARLDASGMSLVNCAGSDLYEWRDGLGTIVGNLPAVDVSPVANDTYTVSLTCSTNAACSASRAVGVTVENRPQMQAVVDSCSCNLGLRLSWSPATFPSGAGFYNVYRSEISPADALTRAPLNEQDLAATTWIDTRTRTDRTYYYVVQAEDAGRAVAAMPPGPNHGGVVSTTTAQAGPLDAAVAVATPELLGRTLRVSHVSDVVMLDWTGARPLLPDEHFRVLKGVDPSRLAGANPDGQVTTTWADADLSSRLQFFDVRIAAPCESMSDDDEPPGWDAGR